MDNPHYVTLEKAMKKLCAVEPNKKVCSGSNCMAWRWELLGHEELKDGSGKWPPIYSTTHGYCGMVKT